MIVLALETATRDGSVALARDGQIVASAAGDGTRPHAARLPGDMLDLLTSQGLDLSDVDLLAVCLGPGAFTGLRVGIAAAQGLALATGRLIVGVSALDALGAAALESAADAAEAAVWMDAARQEVFAARYRRDRDSPLGVTPVGEPLADTPGHVLELWGREHARIHRWIGEGAKVYEDTLRQHGHSRDGIIRPTPVLAPLIATLGARLAAAGHARPPHALRPVYVRRPDAEIARDRRVQPANG